MKKTYRVHDLSSELLYNVIADSPVDAVIKVSAELFNTSYEYMAKYASGCMAYGTRSVTYNDLVCELS